jgi:thiamine-phosphate pyrophosphorylase
MAARRSGVDAVVISPVFASASPSAGRPLGVRRFAAMVREAGVPCYALGGVNASTVGALSKSGAAGIAAIGALTPMVEARPQDHNAPSFGAKRSRT